MTETTLKVPAIHCESCADTIHRTLGAVRGIDSVKVDSGAKTVDVSFEGTEITEADIRRHLEEIGFFPDE